MREINRLKVVLVEQKQTGKWLAKVIGKNETTVSMQYSNVVQSPVETFV